MRSNRVRRIYVNNSNPNSLDSESFYRDQNDNFGLGNIDVNSRLSNLESHLDSMNFSSSKQGNYGMESEGGSNWHHGGQMQHCPDQVDTFNPCGTSQNQPCFPRRPPIIFDGYKLFYKCGIFYILPETQHTDFYRFIYLSSARKWTYQPIHPITLEPIDPNYDQPIYYYTYLNGKGWSLVPNDPTYPQDPSPHTIVGYAYVFLQGCGFCYVPAAPCIPQYHPDPNNPCNPCPSPTYNPCDPCHPTQPIQPCYPTPNPCPTVCTDKILVYDFNYYNPYITNAYFPYYYNAFANGNPGNDPIYRYPYYIENANPNNVVPFIAGGVGYILPYNNNTVEVSFKTKLRINKASANNLIPGQIDLVTNSYPIVGPTIGIPAQIYLLYMVVTPTGTIQSTSTASTISLTQGDLIQSPPGKIQDFGGYYESNDVLITTGNINLLPPTTPAGRRMITLQSLYAFSFVNATVVVNNKF